VFRGKTINNTSSKTKINARVDHFMNIYFILIT